ncbi:MAG TPA: 2-amino-4-hydroxy-6-hydroxymethyldihydropteridine diphosphokinase [Lachnospiraceae bacterium]
MDKIYIDRLEIFANHGVFPEENVLGQKFVISAILHTDTRDAGISGDLSKSIHYGEVSQMITEFVMKETFALIETLAEKLAEYLLLNVKNLREVTIRVDKPWAPIHLPLKTVGVEIHRKWHRAYLSIGSNMGDKKAYLDYGIAELKKDKRCKVSAVSSFIETEPYGYLNQERFLNACLEVKTLLQPKELLHLLNKIEAAADRVRDIHWGPRTLDMDIIFYDEEIVDEKELKIPHAEAHLRGFVLLPLLELAPYKKHPVYQKTVTELYQTLLKEKES